MTEAGLSQRRTLLGGLAVLLASGIARIIAMIALAGVLGADLESADPAVRRDGLLIGVGILAGVVVGGSVLAWITAPARAATLALNRPTARSAAFWVTVLLMHGLVFDAAAHFAGRPTVEPAWVDAYRTAPVLLLAVALTATSIFEELYFRGLLQHGLARTRLGVGGAIGVIALFFAAVHMPDDVFRFVDVATAGLLLGLARHHSHSTVPGMVGHVIGNLKVLVVIGLMA